MNQLVEEIVVLEWTLFDQVENQGGRASCQDDWNTFWIMRSSQLLAWTADLCQSYLADLRTAQAMGRNSLAEKYGYMMERTAPLEYAKIAPLLPPRSREKAALIDEICAIHVAWLEALQTRFPRLSGRGRPIRSREDGPGVTSFETYLWGELATYSVQTLRLYRDYVEQLCHAGRNLNQMILDHTVHQYGWSSLEAAEEELEAKETLPV